MLFALKKEKKRNTISIIHNNNRVNNNKCAFNGAKIINLYNPKTE